MSVFVRPLWLALPKDWERRLDQCLEQAAHSRAVVFFRDDDAAAPSRNFQRMLDLFERWATPLDIAVTPAWLSAPRAEILLEAASSRLFGLHQHGFRHVNHEPEGKKCEFGPARPLEEKRRDLERGLGRLRDLLGDRLQPIFTPPWNRADAESLGVLKELGFMAVSRFSRAKTALPEGLAAVDPNVDLHTRKDPAPDAALSAVLEELSSALASGSAGIMLHHQVMNEAAFRFLDRLLEKVAELPGAARSSMLDLTRNSNR